MSWNESDLLLAEMIELCSSTQGFGDRKSIIHHREHISMRRYSHRPMPPKRSSPKAKGKP